MNLIFRSLFVVLGPGVYLILLIGVFSFSITSYSKVPPNG